MSKWKFVARTKEASEQLAFLLENSKTEVEVRRLLRLLANEDDPRKPSHKDLNVVRTRHEAPKWYRLKISSGNVRIAFRLQQSKGRKSITYDVDENIWSDRENLIDIVKAGYRTPTFYVELRRLYHKIEK